MMETPFRYGDVKKMMHHVVIKLEAAGYEREALAMTSLTHIIASRIEPPDLSNKWDLEYQIECLEHLNSLERYIMSDGKEEADARE